MQAIPPTPDKKLKTYKGVEIYVLDATMGHTRTGWNHHQDRFCVVQWDPVEQADRGLVGADLDDVLLLTHHGIDKRKPLKLN